MLQAVLFDMDGVISDTQKLHAEVESDLLNRYGIRMAPHELTEQFAGVDTAVFFRELFREKSIDADVTEVMEEKRKRMLDGVRRGITPISGAPELISFFRDNGVKTAVASSSTVEFITLILNSLNMTDRFHALVSGEYVENGKPHPDIFLLAAERVGVAPEDCLVIEDARSGMRAAKSAGMKCVGLVPEINNSYPADWTVTELSAVPTIVSDLL